MWPMGLLFLFYYIFIYLFGDYIKQSNLSSLITYRYIYIQSSLPCFLGLPLFFPVYGCFPRESIISVSAASFSSDGLDSPAAGSLAFISMFLKKTPHVYLIYRHSMSLINMPLGYSSKRYLKWVKGFFLGEGRGVLKKNFYGWWSKIKWHSTSPV